MNNKQQAVELLAQLFEQAGVRMTGENYAMLEKVVDQIVEATWAEGVAALKRAL